jgi:hypothetical protein
MPLLRDKLQPTDFADADCRVSGWVPFEHHGALAYRVWECKCSAYWFQRHEWQIAGKNQTRFDDWLFSGYYPNRRWPVHMQPAPKDDI